MTIGTYAGVPCILQEDGQPLMYLTDAEASEIALLCQFEMDLALLEVE
jgi:hypothetical protein